MDPQTITVAHRQAEAAERAERAVMTIRPELYALACAIGFAGGIVFTLLFAGKL